MREESGPNLTSVGWGLSSRFLGLIPALLLCATLVLILVLTVRRGASAQVSGPAEYQEFGGAGVRIVESSGTRIVLEVDVPDYDPSQQPVGDRVYDLVSIPGWSLTQVPGMPQVPTRRVLLGVPPEAELRVAVLDATVREVGPYHIMPAPERVLQDDLVALEDPWLAAPQFETRYTESPAAYRNNVYQPGAVAQLGEVAWLRSQRVAAVELYPILYNAAAGRIRFHPRFRVELSFSYAPGRQVAVGTNVEPAAFEQLFDHELLNYEQSQQWRSPSGVSADRMMVADWSLSSDAYKVIVTENGLYQLTYDYLRQANRIPPTKLAQLNPQTIQVFWMDQEIPIRVVGGEDQSFDSGDYVLFYGQAPDSKYTDRNVYWLTYGQAAGRRMEVRSGKPSGTLPSPAVFMSNMRIEEERVYRAQWPGDDTTDRWYWRTIYSPTLTQDPAYLSAEVDLGHVSAEIMSSTLWISMKGHSAIASVITDHHAVFYVNDHLVGEHRWDGADTVERVRVDFPQDYLNPGVNTVKTDFPGVPSVPLEIVLFDRYELAYGHAYRADSDQLEFSQSDAGTWKFEVRGFSRSDIGVFDISEPLTVTEVISSAVQTSGSTYTLRFKDTVPSTRTYLALTPNRWLEPEDMVRYSPANLRDPANAAEYIIISHVDFLPAASRLAEHRASQGLRSLVVDVQDVYDEFGYGLSVPHAIRDFVRYAYDNWQSTYLVLLGDGTYDPKNHMNQGTVSYLTPYLGFVDPWLGETATDNWFVAVSGGDTLPDLHLGRLPANSLDEAYTMVDKTIAYEQSVAGTDWSQRLTFVAGAPKDKFEDFHAMSRAVISATVPAYYDVAEIYRGTATGSTCSDASDCEQQLLDQINAGTALVNFIGHGSVIQWGSAPGILTRLTVLKDDGFQNPEALPVMLPMTCLDGYFIHALPWKSADPPYPDYPDYPSLSELLVRTPGRGAVASWGPTGLGVAFGHDQLDRGFLEALVQKGIQELGPATYAGKLRLYGARYGKEQIQEYTLFGDPALRLKIVRGVFLPLILKSY